MKAPYEHPPCVVCDGPVVRRIGEGSAKWRARMTCREVCRYIRSGQKTKALSAKRDAEMAKPCLACNRLMKRRATEGRERFAGRVACSQTCQGRVYSMRAAGLLPLSLPKVSPEIVRPTAGPGRPPGSKVAAEIVSPPSSLYKPSERQRREWLQASPDVRRLFAPELRAAMGGAHA